MKSMTMLAPAKINLGLRVLFKRPDGYHEIETLFYAVNVADRLHFEASEEFFLDCQGVEDPRDNLIYQAYALLLQDFSGMKGLSVLVEKEIPVAAGLAGGSTDAAATLLALNGIYDLGLSAEKLAYYALQLGSDVPFMLDRRPSMGRGRGERLTPVELPRLYGVLVNPGFPVSTPEVYQEVVPSYFGGDLVRGLHALQDGVYEGLDQLLVNDLAAPLFQKHPELLAHQKALYDEGAYLAMPSGSGPTLFGLFSTRAEAVRAAENLQGIAPFVRWFGPFEEDRKEEYGSI